MIEQKELSGDVEFIELKPHLVREHLLRLFNSQIQRDYTIAAYADIDGSVLFKLKRKAAGK